MLSCYIHKSSNDFIKHTIYSNVIYLAELKFVQQLAFKLS